MSEIDKLEERFNEDNATGIMLYRKDFNVLKSENTTLRARIAELEKTQIVWHRVEDGLPKPQIQVMGNMVWTGLISLDGKRTFFAMLENGEWTILNIKVDNLKVIAWAELPKYEEATK